jgi:ribose 1,5-bisphosphokinase
MMGCWVFVCGASGAGKDSVMYWAETHLVDRPGIIFSRRRVTRPSMQGSDHDEISISDFMALAARGGFAWHWQANGFNYGIDARYEKLVETGYTVVVNGSREHAQKLAHYGKIRIVQIELSAAELELRLIKRGRESRQKIEERMARNQLFPALDEHLQIVNDGELATAGQAFADYLVRL